MDGGRNFAELARETLLALYPPRVHDRAGALELARCKEGVVLDVLNQQNSESLAHFRSAKRSRCAGLLRALPFRLPSPTIGERSKKGKLRLALSADFHPLCEEFLAQCRKKPYMAVGGTLQGVAPEPERLVRKHSAHPGSPR